MPFAILATLALLFWLALTGASAQSGSAPSRVTPIDESKLVALRGNTLPFARPSFDRGPAADSLFMDQMVLVLQRSPQQQAALDRLLAEQQDKSSPNYHRWLTPDEFGQQFGASDNDIQQVSNWLRSHGFQVNGVSAGRSLINFSGNAGQVRGAFHTAMHQYLVNNRSHWANDQDPQIPAALAPVVAGVRSLNDFFPKPKYHAQAGSGLSGTLRPHLTLTAGSNTFYGVGPTDFATIYGITSLWNVGIDGTGQTIAIVSASDINATDVSQFRTIFSLPAINFQQIIPPGSSDPGIVMNSGGPAHDEDESEAVFDVEWSGAVAKNAKIDLIVSKDTTTSAGIDLSAIFIVNQMTPSPQVLAESFGQCELLLGATGNLFYSTLWQQAAAEGITVSIATGDNGSDACDTDPTAGLTNGSYGLGVNGIASTPFDVAVGGTDFNDHSTPNAFWNASNTPGTLASAVSYVPELVWNDTCTNPLIYTAFALSDPNAACNSTTVQSAGNPQDFFVAPVGTGGGISNCTTSSGTSTASCSGGYAKPSWQTGLGVPADGKRDIPDISLLAEGGQASLGIGGATSTNVPGSFYVACEADAQGTPANPAACSLNGSFLIVGGTSVSAQVFAGAVALLDQRTGSSQGNLNPSFYSLAAGQSGLNCNASSAVPPATCIFNDVTQGTNATPCKPGTHDGTSDCVVASGQTIGILNGYNAGAGYDLATGLGSINFANLANAFPFLKLAAAPSTITIVGAGKSGTATLTFTAVNGFTGSINNLACSGLPAKSSCAFAQNGTAVTSLTFNGSNTTAAVTLTVNTTAAGSAPPLSLPSMPAVWTPNTVFSLAFTLTGLGLLGWIVGQRRYRPVFILLAFAAALVSVGCSGAASGGGSGTPSGTSTVTVTGTNSANGGIATASVTLTVQ